MAIDASILLKGGTVPDIASALHRGAEYGDALSGMMEARRNRPMMRERARLENEILKRQLNSPFGGAGGGMTTDQKNLIQYQQLLKTNPALAEQFGQMTGIVARPQRPPITAKQAEFEQWRKLVEQDSPLADEFGMGAGFVSREGEQLTGGVSKRIFEATDKFNDSQASVNQLNNIASDYERLDPSSGLFGKFNEFLARVTGQEDSVTELRKRYNRIRNSQALKDLPAGPATDKDVEMVLKPFPEDTANPQLIASFLRGMAKVEALEADKAQFEAEFLSQHGSPRTAEGVSMLKAYRDSGRRQKILDTLFTPATDRVDKDFANPTAPTQALPVTDGQFEGFKLKGIK